MLFLTVTYLVQRTMALVPDYIKVSLNQYVQAGLELFLAARHNHRNRSLVGRNWV